MKGPNKLYDMKRKWKPSLYETFDRFTGHWNKLENLYERQKNPDITFLYFSYSACIRRAAGYCCVQYQVCAGIAAGFSLDGGTAISSLIDTKCTGDYIAIPGNYIYSFSLNAL